MTEAVKNQLEGIKKMEEWFHQDELIASVETFKHLHSVIKKFEREVLHPETTRKDEG